MGTQDGCSRMPRKQHLYNLRVGVTGWTLALNKVKVLAGAVCTAGNLFYINKLNLYGFILAFSKSSSAIFSTNRI